MSYLNNSYSFFRIKSLPVFVGIIFFISLVTEAARSALKLFLSEFWQLETPTKIQKALKAA